MKQRDYITTDELNDVMKGPVGEDLTERRQSELYVPLHVGVDQERGQTADYPIFREAALQRIRVVDDDGKERVAWALQTPLIVKFEEDA